MKKIVFALFALLVVSISHAKAVPVPEFIQHRFSEQFPQAKNMIWTDQQNGMYEVDFTYNQQSYAALLDEKGKMLNAGKTLTWFQFPPNVRKFIGETYEGFYMKLMMQQNDQYVAEFTHNKTNYLIVMDHNGTVVSSQKR